MFIIKYWRVIVAVLCFLVSTAVGYYISNKMWSVRYVILETKYTGCQTSLATCIATNKENAVVIDKLRKELKQYQQQCEQRVNYYKKLLKQFQQIDNLTGGKNGEESTMDCPDDVCSALHSMWK